MRISHFMFTATAIATIACAAQRGAAFTCDSDLDGNGLVNTADLLGLLSQWGPCEDCSGDLDGDGSVGTSDLLQLLADWGPCLFDYPPPYENSEAEQIGLEMLGSYGPLLMPEGVYERIDRDLGLIRDVYPDLIPETHSMAWAPNQLIVRLVPGEPLEEYQAHNTYFQVIDEHNIFGDWWTLTFAGNLNIAALAPIYLALDAVDISEPNALIGGQNFYSPFDMGEGTWRWDIDDGFMDCTDGCDCHRHYIIDIEEDGALTLVLYEEWGMPYCEFRAIGE